MTTARPEIGAHEREIDSGQGIWKNLAEFAGAGNRAVTWAFLSVESRSDSSARTLMTGARRLERRRFHRFSGQWQVVPGALPALQQHFLRICRALLHPCRLSEAMLLEQCLMRRTRHSGPGGQHRNKVETAIEIVHEPTGVTSFAAELRSQEANRQVAVFRLRLLLAIRIRSVTSSNVQPTDLWTTRCRNQRISCSERHADFPVMIAEALDAIDAKEFDIRKAAAALGCSASQLVRFIAKAPEALAAVNAVRAARGLHRLQP